MPTIYTYLYQSKRIGSNEFIHRRKVQSSNFKFPNPSRLYPRSKVARVNKFTRGRLDSSSTIDRYRVGLLDGVLVGHVVPFCYCCLRISRCIHFEQNRKPRYFFATYICDFNYSTYGRFTACTPLEYRQDDLLRTALLPASGSPQSRGMRVLMIHCRRRQTKKVYFLEHGRTIRNNFFLLFVHRIIQFMNDASARRTRAHRWYNPGVYLIYKKHISPFFGLGIGRSIDRSFVLQSSPPSSAVDDRDALIVTWACDKNIRTTNIYPENRRWLLPICRLGGPGRSWGRTILRSLSLVLYYQWGFYTVQSLVPGHIDLLPRRHYHYHYCGNKTPLQSVQYLFEVSRGRRRLGVPWIHLV